MKPRDLIRVWDAPDHSQLTPRQWSVRLPLLVAARINALCDLYPRRTKTEIIGDLLATSLEQLIEALPDAPGARRDDAAADSLHDRFERLTERHLAALRNDGDSRQEKE